MAAMKTLQLQRTQAFLMVTNINQSQLPYMSYHIQPLAQEFLIKKNWAGLMIISIKVLNLIGIPEAWVLIQNMHR